MPRESCRGTKELVAVYLTKEVARQLRELAVKQLRNISTEAEYLLAGAMKRENKIGSKII